MPGGIISRLGTFLPKVEIAALVVAAVGFTLRYLGNGIADTLIMISLSALAGVFYLTAFIPLPKPSQSDDTLQTPEVEQEKPKGFALFITVVWKVIHISAAIAVIGLLFYFLQRPGYGLMLVIGACASGFSLFIAVVFVVADNKYLEVLKNALMRIVFLFLLSGYILYNNWPIPLTNT